MKLAFDSATDDDFEDLLALRIEEMQESLERIGTFDAGKARERFADSFSASHTRHILVDELRVGFLMLQPNGDELLLDHMYIRPEYQGRGIGGEVLRRLIAEADTSKLPIRVGALREKEANRFHLGYGFQIVDQGEWDLYYVRGAKSQEALRPGKRISNGAVPE